MSIRDDDRVFRLWGQCEGVGLGEGDSREGIRSFLKRNPGLSFVAVADGEIVGAVMSSHDGRRGFLYHLAVAAEWRRRGIGQSLASRCLAGLRAAGIPKCHIVVFARNLSGRRFWRNAGWLERTELRIMSKTCP